MFAYLYLSLLYREFLLKKSFQGLFVMFVINATFGNQMSPVIQKRAGVPKMLCVNKMANCC